MPQNDHPIALIVGGSTGMGRATARRLLERGIGVHLVARHPGRLAEAQAELGALGSVETSAVDLYDDAAVERLIAELDASKAHYKYLVNAANTLPV